MFIFTQGCDCVIAKQDVRQKAHFKFKPRVDQITLDYEPTLTSQKKIEIMVGFSCKFLCAYLGYPMAYPRNI